jgi:hypothetical protein
MTLTLHPDTARMGALSRFAPPTLMRSCSSRTSFAPAAAGTTSTLRSVCGLGTEPICESRALCYGGAR